MRSYSSRLYRMEDSVVSNKAIQTYSAWWQECQHVRDLGTRVGRGGGMWIVGGLLVRTEGAFTKMLKSDPLPQLSADA